MAKERYPGFDVLEQASHWDELTRALVLDRVERVPELRFFDEREAATLRALCDLVTAQEEERTIPVLEYVDEKLFDGPPDGFRYFDMPDDGETWRRVARGLDEAAGERGAATFAVLPPEDQREVCARFSRGELHGGTWATLNVSRAFGVVTRHVCEAFYAHPLAWNEIGFPGPAYPRGYASLAGRELWESPE